MPAQTPTRPSCYHAPFCPLPTPTHAEVADIARRTADRIEKILQAHGRSLDPEMQDDEPPAITLDEPGLTACYAAAAQGVCITGDRAGQPTLRLVVPHRSPATSRAARAADAAAAHKPAAEVRGVNVYAQQIVARHCPAGELPRELTAQFLRISVAV